MTNRKRVACFVDGFNLYHALNSLGRPHLKWIDLRRLTEHFIDPSKHDLTSVVYFSAFATWLEGPYERHMQYVAALKATGTIAVMGHFKSKDRVCKRCNHVYVGHEEKETDVNIAVWLVSEAYKNNYDEAFIVSRDSDLTPAIKLVLDEFPHKRVKAICPPGLGHCKEIAQLVGQKKLASIKPVHLERSLLPEVILDQFTGEVIARRPAAYAPD